MLSVWLPLNGDLRNQGLSNITATNNGATVDNNGKIGKCYSFDGNDDFINLGNIGSHFDGSAFSICFWIFSLENKTRAAVFSSYGLSSTSNFFGLELNSSNNNYCNNNLRFDWLGSDTYSPDDFVTYNAWTHICVTYDGVNQIKMYKNGELIQTSTRVLNAIPVGNTYYLGRDSRTGSTAFSGKLNDFRIYDHCLSPRECKQVSTALVVHYPLSGIGNPNLCVPQFDDAKWTLWSNGSSWNSINTREKVVDENGKTWIHVVQTTTAGYGGYACTSGINGNGIVIDPNKKYTISVLAKTNETTTQKMILWCHWRVAGGGGSNLAQTANQIDVTSTPKRIYATWTPSAGSSGSTVGSINIMLGVSSNISDIYFTDIKFEEGEIATPYMPYVIGSNNLFDFSSIASKWTVDGATVTDYTDETYGNVLKVVTTASNKRIYKYCDWENSTIYTVSFIAKADTPIVCDMSRSISDLSGDIHLTTEWKRYSALINSTYTGTGTLSFRLRTAGTAYITCITLEKGDIRSEYGGLDNIEYDASGFLHNGFKNGIITISSDTPRYTTSYTFDGTTGFIEADPLPAETKSISVWVKTTWTAISGSAYQFAVFDPISKLAVGFASGGIISYIGASAGGAGSYVATSGKYVANQWNHIVVIKTGDTTRTVYVNGQICSNNANNYWSADLNKLLIGNRHQNGSYKQYFNGQISDFRAYVTELTEEEILELYHTTETLANNGTLLIQGEYVES